MELSGVYQIKKDIKYFVFDVIEAGQKKESIKPLIYSFESSEKIEISLFFDLKYVSLLRFNSHKIDIKKIIKRDIEKLELNIYDQSVYN